MNESAPLTSDSICPRCGLKIGQIGSFTYWIFKDDRCQCPAVQAWASGEAAQSTPPPKHILNNRYELIECVGKGAMGFVYKGIDLTTGDLVALKIMRPELAANQLAVKRLMREVAVVSSLSNSHLGQVHGYGQEKDGVPYLVMEFVEGKNLAEIISDEGKLKVARALDIFVQICSGLMCAHANGIIHRDLKPSNVIIQEKQNGQERAVIVDFGFARLLSDAAETVRLTQQGEAFGSPAYMSPEQCLGEELDVRSDIYSFGCLMYEALTGTPPLIGENVLSTVAKQVRERPVSMRSHNSSIPEAVDDLVMKCLSKEPVLRYQKALDLRVDLEKIKSGDYVNVSSKRPNVVVKSEKSQETKSLRSTEDGYRKFASLAFLVVVTAIVVGAITGGSVWFFMQSAGAPKASISVTAPAADSQQNAVSKETPPSFPAGANGQKSQPKAVLAHPSKLQQRPARVQAEHPRPAAAAAGHRNIAGVKKTQPKMQTNNSGWAQLKELRVHK
ncbi:MAG TPA: serine/threonine-protein kinase [Candidatus Melainabacteria bacterium]|nr:serine/threonine-protein kinase [Candidatus Melainabacteria bacterium]